MKRKVISLFLALMIVFASVPFGSLLAFAVTKPTIAVESKYAAANSSVDIRLNIADNPGVAGAIITISYSSKLTLLSASNGEVFSPLDFTNPGSFANPCNFNWDSESAVATGDGAILNLTFQVSPDAAVNEFLDISVSYKYGDIYDENLNSLMFEFVNGGIAVIDYIPGDVNDDGTVNGKDITLLRRFNAGGYDVTINESAADVNDDGAINGKDVTLIRRYYAGGYGVELIPISPKCQHTMVSTAAKNATCTEDGNIAYWYCTSCEKYFSDENGNNEITLSETVIPATDHTYSSEWSFDQTYHWHAATCEHKSFVSDKAEHTYNAQNICTVCGASNTPDPSKPYKIDYKLIEYNSNKGDTYLKTQLIDNTENRAYFSASDSFNLLAIQCEGYEFLGWYTADGTRITKINAGTVGDITLYAHWQEIIYDITYKLYQTPLEPITGAKYLKYTVSKGLVDLPNPTIYNYVFLGWHTDDGKEMSKIPIGSTGDITLNAHWTSKRNLTKAVDKIKDPILCEDADNGVIYFAYELGTIENVPLSDAIWSINSVANLTEQMSKTVTKQISVEVADSAVKNISNSTVDSGTWTLSNNWNDVTHVNETWAEQNGMTVEEAETLAKTSSDTFSLTKANGGNHATTKTGGTTALAYDSKNVIDEKGSNFDVSINGKYTNSTTVSAGLNAGLKIPLKIGELNIGGNTGVENTSTIEIGGSAAAGFYGKNTTNTHTGTDTTTYDTTVTNDTTSWNNSSTSSSTNTASQSSTVSKALSQVISNTKGYGKSYSYGGTGSETQGISNTASTSESASSTLTYFTSEIETTTKTYSTDGKSEGKYRLVIAGTVHVFGVVGYDVASKSYFVYTYNVLDDRTYEFLDYCPKEYNFDDPEHKDYENGALPFEVPYEVYEYVTGATAKTEGLGFETNSSNGTASVIGYNGTESDVTVPSYISSGNTSYKVTGLSADAFSGKPIRAVVLSEYIDELPDAAFKNCVHLEEISGHFTKIGNEAFSGCVSMKNFNVSAGVTAIGTNAFANVPKVTVKALNASSALSAAEKANPEADASELNEIAKQITQGVVSAALSSGAKSIVLDISFVLDDIELTLEVPEITRFELQGEKKKIYKNLKLTSHADTTVIKELKINDCNRIPLEISSNNLTLEAVSVTSQSYVLLLSADGANVTLIRDTKLISENGNAVVCKNPVLTSVVLESTNGYLSVSGNVYVCGTVTGKNHLKFTDGEIIYITEEEFNQYIKGVFTVHFDANGGAVSQDTATVYYGQSYGELPIPTRDYYTFTGWYTKPEGGDLVEASTVLATSSDITLYAHWEDKPLSDWTIASGVPADAQSVEHKWMYTKTYYTTSSSPELSGWTRYDISSVWSDYGAWSGWSNTIAYASDSRQVETRYIDPVYKTKYNYYRYVNVAHTRFGTKGYSDCTILETISLDYELAYKTTTDGVSCYGTYGTYLTNCWMKQDGQYGGPSPYITSVKVADGYTQYRYRDRSLIYTYYFKRSENLESTTVVTASDTISNVQEWVRYRVK